MRSIVPAIFLSFLLLILVSPVVSAMGVPAVEATPAVAASQPVLLPVWGYILLGVNLLVAGGLAAFPFLTR